MNKQMSSQTTLCLRLYRALARAFPHEFQMLYGEDLERLGEDAIPDVWRRHRTLGLLRLLADIALRLPAEYLSELRGDAKFAARMMAKSPGFSAVAILSLALGIGVCSFFYSAFQTLLFHPLPGARDAATLAAADIPVPFSYFERYRDELGIPAAAFSDPVPFGIAPEGSKAESQRTFGSLVSPEYFAVLGMKPVLGRFFRTDTEKPGTRPAIVVSERFWRTHLHSDPQAAGKNLRVNGQAATILGVAPDRFLGIWPMTPSDIFVPTTSGGAIASELAETAIRRSDANVFHVLLRFNGSTRRPAIEATLDVITRHMEDEKLAHIRDHNSRHIHLLSVNGYQPLNPAQLFVEYVFVSVLLGLILSLACINLANLLLARSHARRKEIAVRLSVGAGRARLVRQLLTESVILSVTGGSAGFVFAYWLASIVWTRNFAATVADANLRPDLQVLLLTLAIAILTGIGFGLVPALHITRTDVATTLKQGAFTQLPGYGRFGIRNLLVTYQVAASLTLLLITSFIVLGFAKTSRTNPGFDTSNLAIFQLDPLHDGYSEQQTANLYKQLQEHLLRHPGVQSVALASGLPFVTQMNGVTNAHFYAPGPRGEALRNAIQQGIGPRYFETLGITPERGREFTDLDSRPSSGALPVVLNLAAAREFFGENGPLGRTIHDDSHTYTVIGVVPDLKSAVVTAKPVPSVYVPFTARPAQGDRRLQNDTLIVRGTPGPNTIANVRTVIASIDPYLTVFNVQSVDDLLHQLNITLETAAAIYGGIGLFGLVLASIGLAGVTAYAVARRRKEIGIRMALGARRRQVLQLVMKEGTILVAVGSFFGFIGAFAISRALSALTSGMADAFASSIHDPLLLAGAPLFLASLALLACYLPARRSARIDPLAALRDE